MNSPERGARLLETHNPKQLSSTFLFHSFLRDSTRDIKVMAKMTY